MKNAWNRDVINGDAHSRAEFFSYGLTTIGIGVIGDKGLSRAGQLGNAAKLGHVGKIGNVANKIPPPIPITKGLTPAFATGTVNTIPYNVMDDLYNRIHQASKEAFGDSRGGKVSVGVGGFKTFKTNELLDQHYKKHGNELKNAFNKYNYSIENYLNDANHVIQKGTYVPELNGYVKLVGGKGSAKYAFVGLDRTTEEITTFHLKSVSELMKKAPSLKLMK
ncbi:hypothetical protein H1Z61_17585 [Bacillus aquiflavi]|uniref:Pre-toxin TG domain-containing protein n=2 Tax=Bacillus aquiflavi TaxID=2672567 RepID=A0A6B3W729_9BACI|nr:hypothetical protein [Bacillus aquiflavi]NEY83214.1 hypothetical protein [Bacillus aquiflavi]